MSDGSNGDVGVDNRGANGHSSGEEPWSPCREHLDCLRGYGLSHNMAVKALYFTGNDCPDLALAWAIENPDLPDEDLPLDIRRHFSDSTPRPVPILRADDAPDRVPVGAEGRVDVACGGESSGSYKMVFVVNSQLGMGVGKLAAQVGHAAIGLYRDLLVDGGAFGASVRMWEDSGAKKICLKGQSTEHLTGLMTHCEEVGLPFHLVEDAGLTQIPSGSLTVLAVFGPESQVNVVTGSLPLL